MRFLQRLGFDMPSDDSDNRRRLSQLACILQVEGDAAKQQTLRPGELREASVETSSSSQSCSGFIVDAKEGYILTTGSLFSHVLPELDPVSGLVTGRLPPGCVIRVSWESEKGVLKSCRGHLVGLWYCRAFADTLDQIFGRSDGWSFEGDDPEEGNKSKGGGVGVSKTKGVESQERDVGWLSTFALVKADDALTDRHLSFSTISTNHISPGDHVVVSGTPFGALCPSAFVGSFSGGVVTNLTGRSSVVLMTDARCLPGTEGAAVFLEQRCNERKPPVVTGLVVAPMCWKTNQWVGLSLACSFHEILSGLFQNLPASKQFLPQLYDSILYDYTGQVAKCHNFLDAILLVKVGSSWGSGVVVDRRRGILLTCRHVVLDAINRKRTVLVRVDKGTNSWCRAKVVYATSSSSVIDLAIIQLVDRHRERFALKEILLSTDVYEGERLFAVGFPLFGPESRLGASVTSGHMSRVVKHHGSPVMLQTSCGVHPGSSGGALISQRTGKLVGVIANNCRDDTHSVTIPHLNFGIPNVVFLKPLRKYLRTGDVEHLHSLDVQNDQIESLWKLWNSASGENMPVKSKL